MSKRDKYELTRRKALAGVGAIGAASTGAALGTSAYFSDRETFEDNQLVAGELDLMLDYQVTYHGGPGRLDEIQAMGYEDAKELDEEVGHYLLEEVPDSGDANWDDVVLEGAFCSDEGKEMMVNGGGVTPIRLDDVKPGDSGCLTTSLHLCDNPGYVWMNGELIENAQNGTTEPEEETLMDEYGEIPEDGQLAEAIETRLWYDENCDCEFNEGEEEGGDTLDLALVLDVSGSMDFQGMNDLKDASRDLVDELPDSVQVSIVTYSSGADRILDLTELDDDGRDDVDDAIDALSHGGSTHIEAGTVYGAEEALNDDDFDVSIGIGDVTTPSGNAREDARKVMVVMSDGVANRSYGSDPAQDAIDAASAAKDESIEVFSVAFDTGGTVDTDTLQAMASEPLDTHFFDTGEADELSDAFSEIGRVISGEKEIFQGTLAELMGFLETGYGIPLDGNRETSYDEIDDGVIADGAADGREPFKPETTDCIGLEWWLPTTVGNEVQTDSVEFDVAFYTEQARHNDGSGPTTAD